ncbi:hypothetical protein [Rheinheimera mangrovi]|jgi:hypothetical protein|uniref:hypothetical protein n=1 Tax=Rheinheimera mangrovi TaxID=2498451 RepID=UPI000F8EE85D|nr:hypothetical protein [Rheinheimera mangrovi]
MASLTTSLDSIKLQARQFALSGNQTRPNPGAAIAKELEPAVQQSKQQQVVSSLPEPAQQKEETRQDSIRVTSTLGKAASSGQLSREEAVAIYKEIASLL